MACDENNSKSHHRQSRTLVTDSLPPQCCSTSPAACHVNLCNTSTTSQPALWSRCQIQLRGAGGVVQWRGACGGEDQLLGSASGKKGHPACSPPFPYHMKSQRPFLFAQASKTSLSHSLILRLLRQWQCKSMGAFFSRVSTVLKCVECCMRSTLW